MFATGFLPVLAMESAHIQRAKTRAQFQTAVNNPQAESPARSAQNHSLWERTLPGSGRSLHPPAGAGRRNEMKPGLNEENELARKTRARPANRK